MSMAEGSFQFKPPEVDVNEDRECAGRRADDGQRAVQASTCLRYLDESEMRSSLSALRLWSGVASLLIRYANPSKYL